MQRRCSLRDQQRHRARRHRWGPDHDRDQPLYRGPAAVDHGGDERERWLGVDRGDRHVLVNLTDFTAAIIDDGEERDRTRSVIGANDSSRRTPEFSDTMEHMELIPYLEPAVLDLVPEHISAMIASARRRAGLWS